MVPVHAYDCASLVAWSIPVAAFRLNAACTGPATQTIDGHAFHAIANQVVKNGDIGKRIVMKFVVEGAGRNAILSTPREVLAAIDRIAMDMHGINSAKLVEGIRKLKRQFHVAALHFNNFSCSPGAGPRPACACQVLLVNKRLGVVGPCPPGVRRPIRSRRLTNPNAPDCQLLTQQ